MDDNLVERVRRMFAKNTSAPEAEKPLKAVAYGRALAAAMRRIQEQEAMTTLHKSAMRARATPQEPPAQPQSAPRPIKV